MENQKFKPILFSGEMVNAILEGRKTQTRRIIKPQPEYKENSGFNYKGTAYGVGFTHEETESNFAKCVAKYKVGDGIWVRETFEEYHGAFNYKAGEYGLLGEKWKPSIFMPKAACRIFLECTGVRVERLQDISSKDAKEEGIEFSNLRNFPDFRDYSLDKSKPHHLIFPFLNPVLSFQTLWQSINGPDSWKDNPWVWVYDFKRIEKPENFI